MGLLDIFRKAPQKDPGTKPAPQEDSGAPSIYSGMRVEVTTASGHLLFAAKMMELHGHVAQLYQYTEADIPGDMELIYVRIRGYNDHERKAVYMEGTISPKPQHVWEVTNLAVIRSGNDRAFFRLDTNLDATITIFRGLGAGEKPCKLLNISVGGACVGTDYVFHMHDKFLLKVKLLEDRDTSVMFCEVLRIIEKEEGRFEYGCQFLELNEAEKEKITQNIFDVQRRKRSNSQ